MLNLKPVILLMSIAKLFSLEKPHFIPDQSKKSMYQSIWQTTLFLKLNKDNLSFSESSPNAIMMNSMNLMSTFSQSVAIKDTSISNKSDSKLEPNKEPKSKLLSKYLLSKKITKSQEYSKFNSKTQNQCVSPSVSAVKFPKSPASKNSSKLTKILGWSKYLPKKIKSECLQFPSKTSQTLISLLKLRPLPIKTLLNALMTLLFKTS